MKILLAPGCSVTYFVALLVAVFETAIYIYDKVMIENRKKYGIHCTLILV